MASGLLQARHGGDGPRRVGRAPKVYEPSPQQLSVSLPPRRPELLASLLAEAVTAQRSDESAREASLRVARERGEALGAGIPAAGLTGFLEALGFEPADGGDGRTLLHNCPFHAVAVEAPELVCGMNHAFLSGCLAASGGTGTTAALVPREGSCCVELRTDAVPG
ncbi:hypothetical protein [Streptomyces sp. NPDC006739]|uniref:hypothetical protein n=1 Tax=Streptomyces sp. NPDC006739 TaxID=3364763 RepID=UPI00367F5581